MGAANALPPVRNAARTASGMYFFMALPLCIDTSERVRAVRAYGEQELEQQLVGGDPFRVAGVPKLPAHLAELARPEREHAGHPLVAQRTVDPAIGGVEPDTREPPPRELIIRARVVAERR